MNTEILKTDNNGMKINLLMTVLITVWKTGSCPDESGSRIVGGSPVIDIREAPYVVNIQLNDPYFRKQPFKGTYAAGTIFSPLYVITACHCVAESDDDGNVVSMVAEYPLQYWRFVAGNTRLKQMDQTAQFRTPASLSHHPKCQLEPHLMNDVGLARMTEPFEIGEYVKPVRFFHFNRHTFEAEVNNIISSTVTSSQSTKCKMAAWGKTSIISILDQFGITTTSAAPTTENHDNTTEDDRRDQLKSLEVYPMYEGQCLVKLIEAIKVGLGSLAYLIDNATEAEYKRSLLNQICGLSKYGNESTCYGDSGSGLVCNGFYVGVTSWSVGCGAHAPDVYQSLPSALDWIEREVCTVRSCQDAINIHQSCKPPHPEYLDKCTRVNNDVVTEQPVTKQPATKLPSGIAHKIATTQWPVIAIANILITIKSVQ